MIKNYFESVCKGSASVLKYYEALLNYGFFFIVEVTFKLFK